MRFRRKPRHEKNAEREARERVNKLAERIVGQSYNYAGNLMVLPDGPKTKRRK